MKLSERIRKERQKTPTPGPAAIRSALVAQGHPVSISYIKLVLWRDRRPKKRAKKKRPWQKHWPTKNSRSQAIKQILEKHPQMKAAAIQAELHKVGIDVSLNLIKVVRHHWKPKQQSKFAEDFKAKYPDFPRPKTQAEIDAEVEDLLNRLAGE